MDYQAADLAKHANARLVLGNAAYLNSNNAGGSWRILAFDPFASPSADKVDGYIGAQKASHGVTTLMIDRVSDPAMLLTKLSIATYNAFLLYDEPTATLGTFGADGAFVGSSVRAFAQAGGTVVVLSGGSGTNEMWDFVGQAQLFATKGFVVSAGNKALTVPVAASGDVVAAGVANVFSSAPPVGTWVLVPDPGAIAVVVEQGSGGLVVVHRPVN